MVVSKVSLLSGKLHQMELPVTQAQIDAWASGVLAQVAFPALSADEREFIISGITPEEWDAEFGKEE